MILSVKNISSMYKLNATLVYNDATTLLECSFSFRTMYQFAKCLNVLPTT